MQKPVSVQRASGFFTYIDNASYLNIQIHYKILYAIDSDEIQELAMLLDDNLPKEKILKLEKMLNDLLLENDLTCKNICNIRCFMAFFN